MINCWGLIAKVQEIPRGYERKIPFHNQVASGPLSCNPTRASEKINFFFIIKTRKGGKLLSLFVCAVLFSSFARSWLLKRHKFLWNINF